MEQQKQSLFTFPRPRLRPDGWPTRADLRYFSPAELAIKDAVEAVEHSGASIALTDAVVLLGKAKERVADHMEEVETFKIIQERDELKQRVNHLESVVDGYRREQFEQN